MSHPSSSWPLIQDSLPSADIEDTGDEAIDILLDEDGDLLVDSDGLHLVGGLESTEQHLRILLQSFLEEWFLNRDFGVPYFQSLLGKKFQRGPVRDIFRRLILGVPTVNSILSLTVDLAQDRTLTVTWNVDTVFGPISGITEV